MGVLMKLYVLLLTFQITNRETMDPEVANNFLEYEHKYHKYRESFLQPKTVQQIKSTSQKQMQAQFHVLSSAQINQQIFHTKTPKMNRYVDILAYEHSRIKLPQIDNYYINANQVKSLVDGKVFGIFSQAPVQPFDNFWQAVYYKDVSVIVMLCSFKDPKRGQQSQQYWPELAKTANFADNIKVTVKKCTNDDPEYVVREIQIQGPKGTKKVTHFHWMGWSDLRRPVDSNINRFETILDTCLNQINKNKHIWLHCSAGIGRTGTLGGVIQAIRYYQNNKKVSIFAIVQNMRKYRYHAVQTFQQYTFLYQYLSKKLQ